MMNKERINLRGQQEKSIKHTGYSLRLILKRRRVSIVSNERIQRPCLWKKKKERNLLNKKKEKKRKDKKSY